MELNNISSEQAKTSANSAHKAAGHTKQTQPSAPLSIRHLWKSPVVRQWLQGDTIHKESTLRRPSRFELILDLSVAGVIHILAEAAAENHTGLGLAKFILTFYPVYSIWQDVRNYSNIHGADDLLFRLVVTATMILLYGYSANAVGIPLRGVEAAGTGGTESRSFGQLAHLQVQAAVAFYLVAKGLRLLLYLYHAIWLPRFAIPLMISALALLFNSAIYFPLLFITNSAVVIALPSIAICAEIASRYVLGLFSKILARRSAQGQNRAHSLVPAYSFEHLMERNTQFVIVIFGELVINCAYIAANRQIGLHSEYGRSALGILIAVGLAWLYFDADSSRSYIHPLRLSWWTNVSYNILHFPLTAAIIIMSASLSIIINEDNADRSLSFMLHGAVATVLLTIAMLGVISKSMDQHRSGLLPRSVRLGLRFAGAALLAVLPLFGPRETTAYIAVVAGIVTIIVIVEILGKLGSIRVDIDMVIPEGERGASSHQKMIKHWRRHEGDLTEAETGGEDVGLETELGDMESKEIHPSQRVRH